MFPSHPQVTREDCNVIVVSKSLNVYKFAVCNSIKRVEFLIDNVAFGGSDTLRIANWPAGGRSVESSDDLKAHFVRFSI